MTFRMMTSLLAVTLALAPRPAAAQGAAAGEKVYAAQKCSICHGIAGKGSKTNPLDGVGAKLSADDIKQWITHPVDAAAKAKSTKKPPMPTGTAVCRPLTSTRSSPTCRA